MADWSERKKRICYLMLWLQSFRGLYSTAMSQNDVQGADDFNRFSCL